MISNGFEGWRPVRTEMAISWTDRAPRLVPMPQVADPS